MTNAAERHGRRRESCRPRGRVLERTPAPAFQPDIHAYTAAMSRTELIEIVDRTSPEDRLFLHAYIEHLARVDDPENGSELDRRLERMRAGQEVSLGDARKLHEDLTARGM